MHLGHPVFAFHANFPSDAASVVNPCRECAKVGVSGEFRTGTCIGHSIDYPEFWVFNRRANQDATKEDLHEITLEYFDPHCRTDHAGWLFLDFAARQAHKPRGGRDRLRVPGGYLPENERRRRQGSIAFVSQPEIRFHRQFYALQQSAH
ncbi:hypothetical protein D3C87_1324880 [compost metagenome]